MRKVYIQVLIYLDCCFSHETLREIVPNGRYSEQPMDVLVRIDGRKALVRYIACHVVFDVTDGLYKYVKSFHGLSEYVFDL